MSRTKTTIPNSLIGDADTARTTHTPEQAPKSRFRPGITEAEYHRPSIASEVRDAKIFHLGLPAQEVGTTEAAVSEESALDVAPLNRARIILKPPGPGSQFRPQRQASAKARPEVYHALELTSFEKLSRPSSTADVDVPRARNELVDLFSGLDSAPVPRRNWNKWFVGLFVSAWSRWRREREINRSIAALSEVDDRTLRDIGIHHRVHIPSIVRHGRSCA